MAVASVKLEDPESEVLSTEVARVRGEVAALRARATILPMGLFGLLMTATLVDGGDRALLNTALEDIRRQFSLADSQLGLLTGAYAVLASLSAIPFGFLTDRVRRTRLIAFGFIPWTIAMVLQGVASSFGMMFGARLFLGSIEATNGPSTGSLLADYFPVHERNRIFGYQAMAAVGGTAAASIAGGVMIGLFGWRWAFVMWGLLGLGFGALVFLLMPEPPRGIQDALHRAEGRLTGLRRRQRVEAERRAGRVVAPVGGVTDGPAEAAVDAVPENARVNTFDYRKLSVKEATREVLKIKTLWWLTGSFLVTAMMASVITTWPATYYRRYHGVSVTGAGVIAGMNAITALFGIALGAKAGAWLLKIGRGDLRIVLLAVTQLLSGLFFFLAFYVDSLPYSFHFMWFGAIFTAVAIPINLVLTVDIVHPYLRGRAAAVSTIVRVIGTAAAPVIFGFVADATGLRSAMLIAPPTMVLGAWVTMIARRTYSTDIATQESESYRQALLELAEEEDAKAAMATSTGDVVPAAIIAEGFDGEDR